MVEIIGRIAAHAASRSSSRHGRRTTRLPDNVAAALIGARKRPEGLRRPSTAGLDHVAARQRHVLRPADRTAPGEVPPMSTIVVLFRRRLPCPFGVYSLNNHAAFIFNMG